MILSPTECLETPRSSMVFLRSPGRETVPSCRPVPERWFPPNPVDGCWIGKLPFEVSNHDCWGNIALNKPWIQGFIHPQDPNVPPRPPWILRGAQSPSCAVGFHMFRSSPCQGPGSLGPMLEPNPQTRPSFAETSLPKNLGEKPWGNTGETRWIWRDDGSWYLRMWC